MKVVELAKANLRRLLKEKLSQVMRREEKTQGVHKRLIEFFQTWIQPEGGFWGLYSGLPDEISLEGLFTSWILTNSGLRFVYPRISSRVGQKTLSFWLPGPKGFEKNKWGILEPVEEGGREIPLNKLSGLLVPGLGFDEEGGRLGRGKAYYDRYLSLFSGIKVGVAFEELLQVKIPTEKHDVKMDFIVTEGRILKTYY